MCQRGISIRHICRIKQKGRCNLAKYLIAIRFWFEEDNTEIKIVDAENIEEIRKEYEDLQVNVVIVKITPKVKKELKKAFQIKLFFLSCKCQDNTYLSSNIAPFREF